MIWITALFSQNRQKKKKSVVFQDIVSVQLYSLSSDLENKDLHDKRWRRVCMQWLRALCFCFFMFLLVLQSLEVFSFGMAAWNYCSSVRTANLMLIWHNPPTPANTVTCSSCMLIFCVQYLIIFYCTVNLTFTGIY